MIKIESSDNASTIVREGEECILFPGMIITQQEVETIKANGDVVYTIDEAIVVVVPKGTQATVSVVPTPEVAETEEVVQEVQEPEVPTETAEQAEVVTETVETPAPVTAKK